MRYSLLQSTRESAVQGYGRNTRIYYSEKQLIIERKLKFLCIFQSLLIYLTEDDIIVINFFFRVFPTIIINDLSFIVHFSKCTRVLNLL